MGTRNLTVVYSGGRHVVAQYGQWDGYPSGQGVTALKFCLNYLQRPQGRELFKKKLKNVSFAAPGVDVYSDYGSRDHGAQILELIAFAPPREKIVLDDSIQFAGDSLFCEWAYVIDLDKCTFEVYEGFNKKPLGDDERFKNLVPQEQCYYQVRRVITYSLDALPTEKDFLAYFQGEYKDDDEEEDD